MADLRMHGDLCRSAGKCLPVEQMLEVVGGLMLEMGGLEITFSIDSPSAPQSEAHISHWISGCPVLYSHLHRAMQVMGF